MTSKEEKQKLASFEEALERFIARLTEDKHVLAVVLVGSLTEETIWSRNSIGLWIVEADGVSRRLRSDGEDERIWRVLSEEGVNIWSELIPRSRFKQMVEGSSRTAFSCNHFAIRKIVYCSDDSIAKWFENANSVATKDRDRELLRFSAWTIHSQEHASRRLRFKDDLELAKQNVIEAAHSVAYTEIIRHGEICEQDAIHRAIEHDPDLFQIIYLDVLSKRKSKNVLQTSLGSIDDYLKQHYEQHLRPLLDFLSNQQRVVPLSEISDHFAFSQVYPWHLLSACDWLERQNVLEKLSAPFKLTKRSHEEVEEPAYFMDS